MKRKRVSCVFSLARIRGKISKARSSQIVVFPLGLIVKTLKGRKNDPSQKNKSKGHARLCCWHSVEFGSNMQAKLVVCLLVVSLVLCVSGRNSVHSRNSHPIVGAAPAEGLYLTLRSDAINQIANEVYQKL
jgi:hypothetical protein